MLSNFFSIQHRILALLLTIGQVSFSWGQAQTYEIDTATSSITFSITHMGVMTVAGKFHTFYGTLHTDAQGNLQDIHCTVTVESIDTTNKKRDQILLSEAYLQATTYPYITFKSLRIVENQHMEGILQIRNVSQKITIPITYKKKKGIEKTYFTGEVTLKRNDFDLDFGAMNALVGNEIRVSLEIHKK